MSEYGIFEPVMEGKQANDYLDKKELDYMTKRDKDYDKVEHAYYHDRDKYLSDLASGRGKKIGNKMRTSPKGSELVNKANSHLSNAAKNGGDPEEVLKSATKTNRSTKDTADFIDAYKATDRHMRKHHENTQMSEYGIFEPMMEGKQAEEYKAKKAAEREAENKHNDERKEAYRHDIGSRPWYKNGEKDKDLFKKVLDKAPKDKHGNPNPDFDKISGADKDDRVHRDNQRRWAEGKPIKTRVDALYAFDASRRNSRRHPTKEEAGIFSDILETQNIGNVAGGSTQNGADAPTDPGNDPADAKTSATATQENGIFSRFI